MTEHRSQKQLDFSILKLKVVDVLHQPSEAEATTRPEVKVGKLQNRNTFESRHQDTIETESAKVQCHM